MSGKEDIKNAVQTFVEQRRNLANTANSYAQQKPEEKETFLKNISQENIQAQLDGYFVDLNMGRYNISDFSKIEEFCGAYDSMFANDAIRKQIANLKEQMRDKRLVMSKEIELKATPELKSGLRQSEKVNDIVISFDHQKAKGKNNLSGKTFTYLDGNGDAVNMVEFDENESGYIRQLDENGNEVQYVLTRDNKLYRMQDNKPQELELKTSALSDQAKRAINNIYSSRLLWEKFANGQVDHLIQKESKIKTLKINEKANTKVNEGQKTTTVNEGEKEGPQTTKVDEGKSTPEKTSDFKAGTDNKHAPGHNDFKWQEMDIIDAMFKEWFLAAANAATNWVLDQTEYLLTGIINEIRSSYNDSKAETAKKQNDPDETHKFADSLQKTSNKKMQAYTDACNNKQIIKDIKEGKLGNVIAENPLLRDFAELSGVNIGQLLSVGDPKKTVPLLTNLAMTYMKTIDDYTRASLLDDKLHDKDAHKDKDVNALYEERSQRANKIIKKKLYKEAQKDPQASQKFDFFKTTMTQISKDMEKAIKFGKKELTDDRYDEKGVRTKNNMILISYNGLLEEEEPTPLREEAVQWQQVDRTHKIALDGLDADQQGLLIMADQARNKRNEIRSYLTQEKAPEQKGSPDIKIPFARGRE